MNEKRFTFYYERGNEVVIEENGKRLSSKKVVEKLNEQQDQISYWKHKVNSLLWILGQFDEEKVKGLLKELDDE